MKPPVQPLSWLTNLVQAVLAAQAGGAITSRETSPPDSPTPLVTVEVERIAPRTIHDLMRRLSTIGSDAVATGELARQALRAANAEDTLERFRDRAEEERHLVKAIARPWLAETARAMLGTCWTRDDAARWLFSCELASNAIRMSRPDHLGGEYFEHPRLMARLGCQDPWADRDRAVRAQVVTVAAHREEWPASASTEGNITWEPLYDFRTWAEGRFPASPRPSVSEAEVLSLLTAIDDGLVAVTHPENDAPWIGPITTLTADGWRIVVHVRCDEWRHIDSIILPDDTALNYGDIQDHWPTVSGWVARHPERWGLHTS